MGLLDKITKPFFGKKQVGNNSAPILNELSVSVRNIFNAKTQTSKKKALMEWYKSQGELTAMINKVARDLVGKYHFEPLDPNDTSRNKLLKAERFASSINYKRNKFSRFVDELVTGEGFAWIGTLSDEQIKATVKKTLSNMPYLESKEKKQIEEKIMLQLKARDDDPLGPKTFKYIPSSTMEIQHDEFGITGYKQVVGVNDVSFNTDEIIRSTFMDIDGKVNGFTPVEAVLEHLDLLNFMWGNMTAFEKNGGNPDKIFVAEDMKTSDPAYKLLKEQLQKYRHLKNKHGNMLFTGKINVIDIKHMDKMQFMEMGLFVMSVIAMQWSLPRSSYAPVVGGANAKDDTGGNAEKAYWENIQFAQELDAETENAQLWTKYFGVKLVYDKTYVQKDVQEETAKSLKLTNVKAMDEVLAKAGKQISDTKRIKLLGLTDEDITELKMTEMESSMDNPQLSNNEVNDSQDQTDLRNKKREEQESTQGAIMKPTGTGKELTKDIELELKETMGDSETIDDFRQFIRLYNEDKAYHPGKPPRIFVRRNDQFTSLKYKSSDFVYKTVLTNEQYDNDIVGKMNLNLFKL